METALDIVNNHWTDAREKDIIYRAYEYIYYGKDKRAQANDFVDANIIQETDEAAGTTTGMKFFNLIKSLQ